MEQRRPRQRLRALGSPSPQKTLLKFFMAIFTRFNPKTLYISTFSHVAASSTSTPSSPSQSWPSGWHTLLAGVGDGSKGDSQVDPPSHTHTHTHWHTQTQANAPLITGFRHKSRAEDYKRGGTRWRKEATLSKCRNQGQDTEINLIWKLKHTLLLYLINQTYGTILSALHFDGRQMNNRVCKYGKGSPYFLAQSGKW